MLPRPNDSHKGNYGHLLLVCGSNAYSGAAVLATGAALKSGCGLVTLHSCARALQATVNKYPSAMLSEDPAGHFSVVPERLERFSAIAVGPGLGQDPETLAALEKLMGAAKSAGIPMVLDADALNLIAANFRLSRLIPDGSVLTPHPGELKRLEESGAFADDGPCLEDIGWVLVKKGWHTRITTASGEAYVNTTGNAGMAKGGSGDVLTGLIGGLLARGYRTLDAALLGVWIHGFAGDRLSEECTPEAYSSLDLIEALYKGFKVLLG
ncbi:MAG: NAD(P)H-hydrate dehydratase [Bacteroidales bacterium]|nr:NAD(P)H-hydrate dehydratase [Bacteroidales bacterium]